MNAIVAEYAPDYPRYFWTRYVLCFSLAIWIVGALIYGCTTWDRAVHVQTSEVVAQTTGANNHLWSMVAGLQTPDQSELGRLAQLVISLRASTTPEVALTTHLIYPEQYDGLSPELGFYATVPTGSTNPATSTFSDQFVVDVLLATPAQVSHLLKPGYQPYGYGNWTWQDLLEGTIGFWLLVVLICWVLRRQHHRWERSFEKRFRSGLSQVSRDVLTQIELIQANPHLHNHDTLLSDAQALFRRVQRDFEEPDTGYRDQLNDLRLEFEAGQQAYNA